MPPKPVCEYGGCDCLKFEQQADQDPNKPFCCQDCDHVQNWHTSADTPQDHTESRTKQKVGKIMERYSAEIASLHQKPGSKASIADAKVKCFAVLKKASNDENHKKYTEKKKAKNHKSKAKAADKATGKAVGTMVDIWGIMMLPEGLTAQGDLRRSSKPEGDREGDLESYGLVVFGNKGELKFFQEWSNLHSDQWLREHLPEPFIYLDTKNIAGGYDFNKAKGRQGRAWLDCKIYIGDMEVVRLTHGTELSPHRIPMHVYTNHWVSDSKGSDFEEESVRAITKSEGDGFLSLLDIHLALPSVHVQLVKRRTAFILW
ncbi:hypothetical protein JB92DRAFT_3099015 [Gautieria morchelliformis]|nr:hypothetical protein JB92DRAFT_3099015 [Gautieria morchelliformis]